MVKASTDRVYTWRGGAHVPAGLSPETVGPELTKLMGKEGRVTAEQLLASARSPKSPLHVWFLWDDTEAAHQYRLSQARSLIRSVQIKVISTGEVRPLAVHIRHVTEQEVADSRDRAESERRSGYYRSADALPSNKVELISALADARSRVASAQTAVEQLMRIAGQSGDTNAAMIALAASSLTAARDAVAKVLVH